MKQIYLAGGCFWGTQHFFKQIDGIMHTEVGYANGNLPVPRYEHVYTDQTGYAETVLIEYNPEQINKLSDSQLENSLKAEAIRIILKHPYERQPDGCKRKSMALGSNLVLSDNYDFTEINLPKPADFSLPEKESYEWYSMRIEGKGLVPDENGDIENFGYDKLIPLAKALNVDPAYLLGIEKTANPVVDGLSDYDIKMLAWFHSLAPEQRKAILTLGGAPAELVEAPDHE
jgi:hypothetical protein